WRRRLHLRLNSYDRRSNDGDQQQTNELVERHEHYSGKATSRDRENVADCEGTPLPGCPEPTLTRYSPVMSCRLPSRLTKLRSRGESSSAIVLRSPGCSVKRWNPRSARRGAPSNRGG